MSPIEIQSLAHELAKALAPLLQQNQDDGEAAQLPDGSNLRQALKGSNCFADADRRLERGGVASAGKRKTLIARHSPQLFNEEMGRAYSG